MPREQDITSQTELRSLAIPNHITPNARQVNYIKNIYLAYEPCSAATPTDGLDL